MNDIAAPVSSGWRFVCPACRVPLSIRGLEAQCSACSTVYAAHEGIWDLLPAERAEAVAPFIASYTRIRLAEGRGSESADFYIALPDCDPRHPLAWQWRIRARTYEVLEKTVSDSLPSGAKLLDLGAGVGWMSRRLAERGFRPCAVDLSTDPRDGLAAARHYRPRWPRVRAEFDRLPFPPGEVDAVVYNAAFHYSSDYAATLREALRVLRPGGLLAIADSPVYFDAGSGRRMLEEQRESFIARFGDPSTSAGSVGFLTWSMLDELATTLRLHWHVRKPWYGLRWALRRPLARVMRRREPAQFALICATAV